MKHILDANTFLEAKNRYYNMRVCPAYWGWILQKFGTHEIESISIVGDELLCGQDELADWVKANKELFVDVTDDETQSAFVKIANFVESKRAKMKVGAVEEFLSGADPWLIARALATGATVVTHERHHPEVVKKFLIPNICKEFGVKWIDTFELLYKLDARFVLAA